MGKISFVSLKKNERVKICRADHQKKNQKIQSKIKYQLTSLLRYVPFAGWNSGAKLGEGMVGNVELPGNLCTFRFDKQSRYMAIPNSLNPPMRHHLNKPPP
jgi:hypothetical protein